MNNELLKNFCILIADDDEDDREMLKEAFAENNAGYQLSFVENGEELMHYLKRKGKYGNEADYPFPSIILLDLNMPRKDGREALREIKTDDRLRRVPVVVFTTSTEPRDLLNSYDLGVNSFVIKPVTFNGLIEFTQIFGNYWNNIARLPQIK